MVDLMGHNDQIEKLLKLELCPYSLLYQLLVILKTQLIPKMVLLVSKFGFVKKTKSIKHVFTTETIKI